MNFIIYLSILIILFFVSMPIPFSMLLSSIIYLMIFASIDLAILPQQILAGLDSFPLLAVPFFVLMGELLGRSGMTTRLVNLGTAIIGHVRGGLAHVAVVTEMLLSGVSGSAVADATATGEIFIPAMIKEGYDKDFTAVLLAAASTIGPIIPPSILFVIFGSMANVSVGRLFLGGVVPGVLMGLFLMAVILVHLRGKAYGKVKDRFSFIEFLKSLKENLIPLSVPIIIIGGIVGGIFTPTESGVIATIYILLAGVFLYRTLGLKEIVASIIETVHMLGALCLVVAAAAAFGWILNAEKAGDILVDFLLGVTSNKLIIFFLINLILLILGCMMEAVAILVLLSPIFINLATGLGIDPVHFGVVMVLNLSIGLITPPVGLCMYVTMGIANVTMEKFAKKLGPSLIALILVLILITIFPQLVLYIPNLLMPVK